MWYTIIDLEEGTCSIYKDKKDVVRQVMMSGATLDKRMNGSAYLFHGKYIIGKGDLVKSARGGNNNKTKNKIVWKS